MKLLFTDIDGVFNSTTSRRRTRAEGILHDAVTRFDQLLLDLDAHVVVTSEWRKYTSLDDICTILGTTQRARFYGMTPVVLGNKSTQIQAYLDATYTPHRLWSWVIIDDNPAHFTPAHRDRLIRINPTLGLTDTDVTYIARAFMDPRTKE